jgi:signal transduction histidine kinase
MPGGTGAGSGGVNGVQGFLDTRSILFSAGVASLVGSLLLLRNSAYALGGRSRAVPFAWLSAAFLQAVATFGHSLRDELPPWVVFGVLNTMQILAISLLWLGAGRLQGEARPAWMAVLPPAAWLAAFLVPGAMALQPLRLAIYVPLAYGPFFWAVVHLFGVWRRHQVRAALDMAVLVGSVAACLLGLVLYTIAFPRIPDGAMAMFVGLPGLVTALYATTLPFLMLAVIREWDSIEERGRREAVLQAGRLEVERLHAALPAIVFLARVTIRGKSIKVERVYRGGDSAFVFGWPPGELPSFHAVARISDHGTAKVTDQFRKTVEAGEHKWEWRIRRQDGSWSWIRTRARLLATLPCGAAEIVGYNLNIDREREAEARAMTTARLASLGEMAGGLAHEIRQPLQSISLAAEVAQFKLQEGNIPEVSSRLDWIVDQTQRTSDLIESLRRFARGAGGTTGGETVCVTTAIEAVLQLMRGSLRDALIDVDVVVPDQSLSVQGQSVLIEQVLSNLVLNARDALASQPAGTRRRIRIEAMSGPEETVRLVLSDTGGGIAEEVMARLFEPFVTTKGPDRGTGLGLSICHGFIRGMGGNIEARNDAAGAVFTITLPRAGADGGERVAPEDAAP